MSWTSQVCSLNPPRVWFGGCFISPLPPLGVKMLKSARGDSFGMRNPWKCSAGITLCVIKPGSAGFGAFGVDFPGFGMTKNPSAIPLGLGTPLNYPYLLLLGWKYQLRVGFGWKRNQILLQERSGWADKGAAIKAVKFLDHRRGLGKSWKNKKKIRLEMNFFFYSFDSSRMLSF